MYTIAFFQLQIFSFNSQLFANYSDAVQRSHGIVVLSLLVQVRYVVIIQCSRTIIHCIQTVENSILIQINAVESYTIK